MLCIWSNQFRYDDRSSNDFPESPSILNSKNSYNNIVVARFWMFYVQMDFKVNLNLQICIHNGYLYSWKSKKIYLHS